MYVPKSWKIQKKINQTLETQDTSQLNQENMYNLHKSTVCDKTAAVVNSKTKKASAQTRFLENSIRTLKESG